VFADGRIEKYKLSFKDLENYDGQLTKVVEFNLLSPLFGFTQFSFEKSISPLKSYELGLGIIGAGKNSPIDYYDYNTTSNKQSHRNAFGAFVEAGYKFKKLPNFFNRGVKMTHIMQGSYIKPTLTFGYYSDKGLNDKTGTVSAVETRHNVFGALILNLGHQWVYGDKFLVDLYFGLGYVVDNSNTSNGGDYSDSFHNHFVILKDGPGTNLGFSGGLRIGLLIK